ncbi:hypothetical protein GCM10025791_44780 [Halioxenophilus aromaticivorans]|uniref:Uncharacterized protein n=1 Tax=Halioxenophilus aromaticivorans TaxID=1306992 RepID=A0AAV3U907_9ALTE
MEEVSFYAEKARLCVDQLGIDAHELDIATVAKQDIRQTLERCDYVYLSGGKPYYLLQQLRATGADRWILNEAGKGMAIIGESAASIVMAPSINYLAAMDDPTVRQA